MTTTELIKLLKRYEFGASKRPREITIYSKKNRRIMTEDDTLEFQSSGDGICGAELGLGIVFLGEKK